MTTHIKQEPIPEHLPNPRECKHLNEEGFCYYCCETCNWDNHVCNFCGEYVNHFDQNLDHSPHPCYEVEVK